MHKHYYRVRMRPGQRAGLQWVEWHIEIVLERFHEETWTGPFKPAVVHRFYRRDHAEEWMVELNKARGTDHEDTLRYILRTYKETECVS